MSIFKCLEESSLERIKLVVAMLTAGSIGIFLHFIPLPSAVVAMFRALLGSLFLIIVIMSKNIQLNWPAVRKNWKYLALSGTAIGFNWIFLFEAYNYTSVAVATLCYYMAPIFVILLAPLILKEKLTKVNILTTVIAVIGAVLISGVFSQGQATLVGVGYGLLAAVFYAFIMILNRLSKGLTGLELTFFQLLVSAVVMGIYVVPTHNFSEFSFNTQTIILLLIVGIVHTGWSYQLFFSAINQLPTQTSSILTYIDPITAIILSTIILNQSLQGIQIIGTLLILGSTILNEYLSFKMTPKEEVEVLTQPLK